MNLLTIILILVGITLAIVGAAQRAKIALWIRSGVDSFLSSKLDNTKVAGLKLKDLKIKVKHLINQAAELFAEETVQTEKLNELKTQSDKLIEDATKAKKADKVDLAKEKLRLQIEIGKQITLLEESIVAIGKGRVKLESNIQKIKTYITQNAIRLTGLSNRKKVNDLLKQTNLSDINGDTLEETLDSTEDGVHKDELKLNYLEEDGDESEENYTEELEKKFESL